MLKITNLHAEIEGKAILNGIDLEIPDGEVHAIMGPNGSGKSTLSYVLAGRDDYEVTAGDIALDGESLIGLEPDERAARGLFLAFQYPLEIPGVSTMTFLKAAVDAQRKRRGEPELKPGDFLKSVRAAAKTLGVSDEMLKRSLNVGFSGGEKKRMEILQMTLFEPRFCVLDETDSGLDIDALRIVSEGVNALRAKGRSMLVITHYQRLLDYIVPDRVHVLAKGRIVHSGTKELASETRGVGLRRVPRGRLMSANVRSLRTPAEEGLIQALGELPSSPARDRALGLVSDGGLPHRRVEQWKYFDLRAMMRDARSAATAPEAAARQKAIAAPVPFKGLSATAILFVDGYRIADLPQGLEAGLTIRPLDGAADLGRLSSERADTVVALAEAFTRDGVVIEVAADASIETPILLDFQASGASLAATPRVLVSLGAGASLHLIEAHRGTVGAYQVNALTEISIGDGARLDHVKLQAQSAEAIHLSSAFVDLGARAAYHGFALEEGGAQCRRQTFVRYSGEHAHLSLAGATLGAGRQHIDTTLVVDHAVAHGTSRETFKLVLADEARGVFQGKIIVRPHAQKTDGKMRANALLLNEGPEFDGKPELEIYADDVVCAHGATAGAIDEDLMFYLRARGIPERQAKSLLATAFVGEALEEVENEAVRDALSERIAVWLEAHLR